MSAPTTDPEATATEVRSHDDYRHRRYLPELDGLRALSILLVFTTHIDALWWEWLHGSTGVTVFFVLSGYLITTLSLREEAKYGRLDLVGFYIRRVFRIYPLYVAVLAFYAVLLLGLGFAQDRRDAFVDSLPYYAAFLPEQALLVDPEPPFAGAWSLGIEEKFYFVWPLLGFVVLAGRFRARVFALVTGLLVFTSAMALGRLGDVIEPYALICLGCLAGVLLHDGGTYAKVAVLGRRRVLLPVIAVTVLVQLTLPWIVLGGPGYLAFGIPVAAVLVGVVTSTGRVPALLSSRPLVFLGRISYAFYLTHNFALNFVQAMLPDTPWQQGLTAPAIALAVAIAVSWVLHVTLEKPMIRVGHRLAHRDKADRSLPAA